MLLKKERQLVVDYCRRMINDGLTKGTGGNISILDREKNLLCISSSGQDYFEMEARDVVVMKLDGTIVDGDRKPSSEYDMHRLIYLNFPGSNAVLHCHSTYATALSILREDLPASSYLLAAAGGNNVRCAEYQSFGTVEIGKSAVNALQDRFCCLLANHGLIAHASTIEKVYSIASTVEECSQTYMIARAAGTPIILDDAEMKFMKEKFKTYGR